MVASKSSRHEANKVTVHSSAPQPPLKNRHKFFLIFIIKSFSPFADFRFAPINFHSHSRAPSGNVSRLFSSIYFFMAASRRDFPGENFTTLRAGIRIFNPVNGQRPERALCSRTEKAPMPDQESFSPLAIQSTKIFSKAPIAFKTSTARNPLVAAIAFIKSCLFMVLIF